MDMYREIILDHARNPRFPGILSPADIDHEERNPLCGDRLRLTMRLDADQKITEIAWDGEGCAISQAAASMLAEELVGKTIDEVRMINKEHVLDLIGIPLTINRVKCALLCLKTVVVGTLGVAEWQIVEDEED